MWAGGGRSPTQAYIDAFTPARYELSGSDFLNERYSPKRIGKPLDQIDEVKDYDFELLAKVSGRLADVDRRQALKAIFEKITSGARTETEREVKLLEFLHQSGYHNIFVQPMYEDGQAVFDPLVLLELGEMRCGQVARIAMIFPKLRATGPNSFKQRSTSRPRYSTMVVGTSSKQICLAAGRLSCSTGVCRRLPTSRGSQPSWTVFHQDTRSGCTWIPFADASHQNLTLPIISFPNGRMETCVLNFIIKQPVQTKPLQVSGMVGITIGQRLTPHGNSWI